MEHDFNILMIFGIKNMYNFDSYNVLLSKYTCAAYDCLYAPGTFMTAKIC